MSDVRPDPPALEALRAASRLRLSRLLLVQAVRAACKSALPSVGSADDPLRRPGEQAREQACPQGNIAIRTMLSTFWSKPSLRIGISSGWNGFFMTKSA